MPGSNWVAFVVEVLVVVDISISSEGLQIRAKGALPANLVKGLKPYLVVEQ
jgi:hypothetical protein